MDKQYRINTESGMIHDLSLPCWWATHTRQKHTADFATQEEAIAAVKAAGMEPVICGRCSQRRTSKKFLSTTAGSAAPTNAPTAKHGVAPAAR